MDAANEKESLIALPLQERAVAVALKHIFDKIKELEEEETRETQKIHQTFIARFKDIEHKVLLSLCRAARSSRVPRSQHNSCRILIISSRSASARMLLDWLLATKALLPTG